MAKSKHAGAGNGEKMERKVYEKELRKLQVELCYLQDWVKATGARIIVLFEGRDAAGKGGTIKAITERVSPRVFRVTALPAPSDREKSQMFLQRYMERFPGRRRGHHLRPQLVQSRRRRPCHGLCHKEQHRNFLKHCPEIEQYIVAGGIILIKMWLEVGQDEQEKRFLKRINDPIRQWKLSPMDLESYRRWYEFSKARDVMLKATDTTRAVDHRAHRRQAARTAQLHCPYPVCNSVQEDQPRQGQAAETIRQREV